MTEPQQPSRFSRSELGVVAFTLAYMAVSLAAALRVRNAEFAVYFVVMCILIGATALLHWRVRLSLGALWGLSLWGLAHMAGGLAPVPGSWPINGEHRVLYSWWLIPGWLKYDQVVHACGFGVTTWVCWQALRAAFARRGVDVRPTVGLLALCVAGGMGFGAANEVVEFVLTLLLPSTNVGGYANTGWDLVSNLVGCLFAGTVIYFWPRTTNRTGISVGTDV